MRYVSTRGGMEPLPFTRILLGGLAPLYAPRLSAPLRTRLRAPRQDALGGAVSMAVRRFGGGADG